MGEGDFFGWLEDEFVDERCGLEDRRRFFVYEEICF